MYSKQYSWHMRLRPSRSAIAPTKVPKTIDAPNPPKKARAGARGAVHAVGGIGGAGRVHGGETVDALPQIGRHGGEGGDLIGVEGVAPHRRHDPRGQTRPVGRKLLERPVGVPVLREQRGLFVGHAVDGGDVGPSVDRVEERIVAEGTEGEGEAFEIVVGHRLVGEHQHMVLEPGPPDGGDGVGGEGAGQVDPADAGAARLTRWCDLERHLVQTSQPRSRYSGTPSRPYGGAIVGRTRPCRTSPWWCAATGASIRSPRPGRWGGRDHARARR